MFVRMIGVEPTWITPLDPKSSASANFATSALCSCSRPSRGHFRQRAAKVRDFDKIENRFVYVNSYLTYGSYYRHTKIQSQ